MRTTPLDLFDISIFLELWNSESAINALSALAQPTRLAVFRLLVRHGLEGVPAGQIAREIGTPANTMSAHLTILERASLITAQRDGRTISYALAPAGLRALFAFLAADCCAGRPDLCAPLIAAESCCEPV